MKNNLLNIILTFACLNVFAAVLAKECSVRIRGDMTIPTALILNASSYEFIIPNARSNVIVKAGQSISLWCSDRFEDFNQKLITATCISGVKFNVNGKSKNFNNLTCKSWPTVSAEKTGKSCNGGETIKLGYRIDKNNFAEQMQICFDPVKEVTHYVEYTLGPYSIYYQTKVDRPDFEQLDFFGKKNVQNLYTKKKQKATFKKLLNTDVSKYYKDTDHFLARGHIAAKADFVYGAQERGTFVFINVAPQWQSINAGNWNDIEEIVRELANDRKSDLTVYSGVYGVTTLANNKGIQTPLYLSVDNNNKNQIPVPKLFFRVIVERETNLGVVFITLNNPHLTSSQIANEYTVCKDISKQLSYFNLKKKTDLSLGYTIACNVSDFMKNVKNVPQIKVSGILD